MCWVLKKNTVKKEDEEQSESEETQTLSTCFALHKTQFHVLDPNSHKKEIHFADNNILWTTTVNKKSSGVGKRKKEEEQTRR